MKNRSGDKKGKDTASKQKDGDHSSKPMREEPVSRPKKAFTEAENTKNELERNLNQKLSKPIFDSNDLVGDKQNELSQSKSKPKKASLQNFKVAERDEIFKHLERFDEKLEEPAYDSDLDIL